MDTADKYTQALNPQHGVLTTTGQNVLCKSVFCQDNADLGYLKQLVTLGWFQQIVLAEYKTSLQMLKQFILESHFILEFHSNLFKKGLYNLKKWSVSFWVKQHFSFNLKPTTFYFTWKNKAK